MELEKRNEVVWSIKRTNQPGKFILHFADQDGKTAIKIGLNRDNAEIIFDMDITEFNNFYGIISAFKELIDNSKDQSIPPIKLQTQLTSVPTTPPAKPKLEAPTVVNPPKNLTPPPAIPAPAPPESKTTTEEEQKAVEVAESLKSLDAIGGALDEISKNFGDPTAPPAPIDKKGIEKVLNSEGIIPNPEIPANPPLVAVKVPPAGKAESVPAEKKDSKGKLKETEWDPW